MDEHGVKDIEVPLREYLESQVYGLRQYFESRMAEKDLRDQQRFDSQKDAIGAALLAQKEAVDIARVASEKAGDKAEAAYAERFASVNEFRAQQQDLIAGFMTRVETQSQIKGVSDRFDEQMRSLSEKVDTLKDITAQSGGSHKGTSAMIGYVTAAGGVGVALLTVVVSVVLFMVSR